MSIAELIARPAAGSASAHARTRLGGPVLGFAALVASVLSIWGWIAIGFGALESLAALSVWRGGGFGRWFEPPGPLGGFTARTRACPSC